MDQPTIVVDTRESFEVVLSRGEFKFADTPQLRKARLQLVTQSYLKQGFISQEHLNDEGLFIDEYEERGDPYVVLDEHGNVCASVRLVFGSLNRIPMGRLDLYPAVRETYQRHRWCEWTQVVIAEPYRSSTRLFFDITAISMIIAVRGKARLWAAVVNEPLYLKTAERIGQPPISFAGDPQKTTDPPYRDPGQLFPMMADATEVSQKIVPMYTQQKEE